MDFKRITVISGHFGSGKTGIAVNMAFDLKKRHGSAAIADLDIVNPYFRTKDSEAALAEEGIGLIVSEFANSNVDLPAMPKETYGLVSDPATYGVLDIGGDDRGALALGRYTPAIKAEGSYEMLFVVNRSRPLTRTVADTLEVMGEIQEACDLPFTAIVNNTNLGLQTTAADVLSSMDYAQELSRVTGLPLKMTCAAEHLCRSLEGKIPNLFPLSLQKLYYMIDSEVF